MTTSTSAPTLRRAFLPFSSVTTFSTRISRYSSSASSIPICAFSGSLGRAGSITFCTLPRIFRFLLLMGNLQLEGRASRFYIEASLQGALRVERQPCPESITPTILTTPVLQDHSAQFHCADHSPAD